MTIGATLNSFYKSFGIPAYAKTSVPDNATMPYITYDVLESSFLNGNVSQTVQIWYKTTSEAGPSAKAKEIGDAIGEGGRLLPCEEGYVWLRKGSPFCINAIGEDNSIKLRQLNVTIEFLT